ncbi:hypothetical protein OFO73_17300 [Escherichia coli]|jgi:flavodoxin|nr:hypothetical protein [Escherichia coli]
MTRVLILYLVLSAIVTGCAKPAPANFNLYNSNIAWDAALLLDMNCQDYINASSCQQKRTEAQQTIKDLMPELYKIDGNKLSCIYEKSLKDSNYDFSGEFIDFVESRNMKHLQMKTVFIAWFESYHCSS